MRNNMTRRTVACAAGAIALGIPLLRHRGGVRGRARHHGPRLDLQRRHGPGERLVPLDGAAAPDRERSGRIGRDVDRLPDRRRPGRHERRRRRVDHDRRRRHDDDHDVVDRRRRQHRDAARLHGADRSRRARHHGSRPPTRVQLGESVTFDVACEDAVSGIASCESNVADGEPLPTGELGEQRVTVSALDVAGNLTSTEFVYEVVPDVEGPALSHGIAPVPGERLVHHRARNRRARGRPRRHRVGALVDRWRDLDQRRRGRRGRGPVPARRRGRDRGDLLGVRRIRQSQRRRPPDRPDRHRRAEPVRRNAARPRGGDPRVRARDRDRRSRWRLG